MKLEPDLCMGRLAIDWGSWVNLEGCWRGDAIPKLPGLYRIHRGGRTNLDYIGQTGMGQMTLHPLGHRVNQ